MYKLVLVDDESDVREGILKEIDWEKLGFEIVGTAENGNEAFEIIERVVPDVVITDIKMPFMDGLKLSELIRQRYPAAKIIILTGFEEFEFAQKAIKLHIDEYVLKPFSSQELMNTLTRIKSQIDEEIAHKKNIQVLREHYTKSLPVLKENFLTLLITRKLKKSEIQEKSSNYNINLNGRGFLVSVISMDTCAADFNDALNPQEDREFSLFAVLNVTEEIIDKYRLGMVFIHDNDIVVLTVCMDDETDMFVSTVDALEEIRYSIEKYFNFTVTIGVGTYHNDISNIHYSYKDAVLALDYRLILGTNRIICINDLEVRPVKYAGFDELKEQALTCCIKVGTVEEITELIDSLFNELIEANVSYKEYQIYLMEMLTSILKIAKDADINLDNILDANLNLFVEICRFNNIKEAKDWTIKLCTRIMDCIASNRRDTCRYLARAAKEYTRNHYHESDITINKVCKYLHISPGYFSTIFKKEVKMTYINYLVQFRMEAAKELLRTTELKNFEVAERVGFSEANYFSNCFKKNFGISPSEYRNKN